MVAPQRAIRAHRHAALALLLVVAAPPAAADPDTEAGAAPLPTIAVREPEAAAAPPESTRLDDIIVTADKRVKSLRDLPGSVAAVRGDDLEAMHAEGMQDYLSRIPGVSFSDQGSESSLPIIRGIATELTFAATAATTGIYLDDMPFTDLLLPLSVPDVHPFDLERVEILKGPQGTLFGSGALAGAVRYVARKPTPGLWEAKVLSTTAQAAGSEGLSLTSAGAFNMPLGDAAAIRAAAVSRRGAGLYDVGASDANGAPLRADPDADRSRQSSTRVLAAWQPLDRLHLSAFFLEQQSHFDEVPFADQARTATASALPFPSPKDHDFSGANFLAEYDLGWGRVLSSTNRMTKYNDILTHAEWFFDLQQQDDSQWYDQTVGDVRGLTQELRLRSPDGGTGDWHWLVGASYLRYASNHFQYEPEPGPQPEPPPKSPDEVSEAERAASFLFVQVDSTATEAALFGEASYRLTDRWELTAGLRQFRTRLVADTVLSGAQIFALVQQTEDRAHFEPESDGLNPKLAARYLHSEHVQLYALAAKGFQFGGVQLNPRSPLLVQSAADAGFAFGPYDSSKLWNYEAGVRTEWLDRRLRFDVAAFYLDWKDLQLNVRAPISGTNATFNIIANVGRAHSEGVEAGLEALLLPGLTWTSAAAWIDAVTDEDFDEFNAAGPVRAGTRLPGTPRFQASHALSHEAQLPAGWGLSSALSYSYLGASPDAIRPTGSVGGYAIAGARIALLAPAAVVQPELSLAINNLTDVRGVAYHRRATSATSGTPMDFYHFADPRTVILAIGARF